MHASRVNHYACLLGVCLVATSPSVVMISSPTMAKSNSLT